MACLMSNNTHHSEYAFSKFFLLISNNIRENFASKQKFSELSKIEFTYNIYLLPACFCISKRLYVYKDELISLFKTMLMVDFQDKSTEISLITNTLSYLFVHLTCVYPYNQVFKPIQSECSSQWPHLLKLKDLPLNWHIPNRDDIEFARELVREFINPQMVLLENWATSKCDLTLYQLKKSLIILLSLVGLRFGLPKFSDEYVSVTLKPSANLINFLF